MNNTLLPIDEWISDELSGDISAEDQKKLSEWICSSEENRRYFLRQQEIWFSCMDESEKDLYDKQRAFEAFQSRIRKKQNKVFSLPRWMRYAAAMAGVVMLSYFSYYQGEMNLKQALTEIRVQAPVGSQTRLVLPDQSVVVLNAGSTLCYAQDFGVYNRNVELEGEAYFEVTPHTDLPFKVEGKSVVVKVLGTRFNLKDYPEDEEVSVHLYQGKVAIDNRLHAEEEMVLHPNESMVMNRMNGRMVKAVDATTYSSAWRDGHLLMRDMPLSQVVHLLERSYGVHIEVANDSLNQLKFNGYFDRKEMSVKEILEVLAGTQRIRFDMKNTNIRIY